MAQDNFVKHTEILHSYFTVLKQYRQMPKDKNIQRGSFGRETALLRKRKCIL